MKRRDFLKLFALLPAAAAVGSIPATALPERVRIIQTRNTLAQYNYNLGPLGKLKRMGLVAWLRGDGEHHYERRVAQLKYTELKNGFAAFESDVVDLGMGEKAIFRLGNPVHKSEIHAMWSGQS